MADYKPVDWHPPVSKKNSVLEELASWLSRSSRNQLFLAYRSEVIKSGQVGVEILTGRKA